MMDVRKWRGSIGGAVVAALTTAGGLVVGADGDRYLNLHDVATGEVLFSTRLPAQGYPVIYAVDAKQYLAVAVGGDVWQVRQTVCSSSACRTSERGLR